MTTTAAILWYVHSNDMSAQGVSDTKSLLMGNENQGSAVSSENRVSAVNDSPLLERQDAPGSEPGKGHGYVLVYKGKRQLTSGLLDMFTQNCLFRKISPNIKYVEPFVDDSVFGFSPVFVKKTAGEKRTKLMSLYDIYDHDWIDNVVKETELAPIVSFKDFLARAPREIVLVVNSSEDYDYTILEAKINQALGPHGFYIKRVAYLNPLNIGLTSKDKFSRTVYQDDKPEDVSVIINHFGTVVSDSLSVNPSGEPIDVPCDSARQINTHTAKSSPLIKKYAQKYIHEFLEPRYISVMFRTEYLSSMAPDDVTRRSRVARCRNNAIKYLNRFKAENNISRVFVSLDIGRHGSHDPSNTRKTQSAKRIRSMIEKDFITAAYGDAYSFGSWEDTFDSVTGSVASGVTASLQKEISINADCIVLAGGGGFQMNASVLFARNIRKEKPPECIVNLGPSCYQHTP